MHSKGVGEIPRWRIDLPQAVVRLRATYPDSKLTYLSRDTASAPFEHFSSILLRFFFQTIFISSILLILKDTALHLERDFIESKCDIDGSFHDCWLSRT